MQPHPQLVDFYEAPSEKRRFIVGLFDENAQHYAHVDRVISLGSGLFYRQRALARAGLRPGMQLLDVGMGTGYVVRAALRLGVNASSIFGLDPSLGMLREARKTLAIPMVLGCADHLPFQSSALDFVTMGFALRHVTDLHCTFREYARVLRPGGRMLVLEISKPRSRLGYRLGRWYFGNLVPWFTRVRTGSRPARMLMRYYWKSIENCVPPDAILRALEESGFRQVVRRAYFGIFSEYRATRR
jgi:demethylmenaquinone methyltransferase/2-methoxy-6-polyprenyl-1,4-benzoquinol methylase